MACGLLGLDAMASLRARFTLLIALLLLVGLPAGCAGDLPENAKPDSSPWSYPEASSWPEGSTPSSDQWPGTKLDSYQGAPFGCQTDTDCFGLRCCDTPWGVRLCAERCP